MKKHFQIEEQLDKKRGCIPASAISVLKSLGVDAPAEAELVSEMWLNWTGDKGASGFERLRVCLERIGTKCQVRIKGGRLLEILEGAGDSPVLVAVRNNDGSAHCGVATGFDRTAETVIWADPARATTEPEEIRSLEGRWTKEAAILEMEAAK